MVNYEGLAAPVRLVKLLVTLDKDFGELVYRQGLVHAGVILLRLAGLQAETKAALASQVIEQHGQEMQQAFSVVSPATIRIRKQRSRNSRRLSVH